MIVGPLDGPLERDGQDWPETAAVHAALHSITVAGINTAAAISITGGEYSIDGGTFICTAGTVGNGQTISVRQTSSASFSTTTDATLIIGGVSDTFSVTTLAADTTPNAFSFTDQTDATLSTVITSNSIMVAGINSRKNGHPCYNAVNDDGRPRAPTTVSSRVESSASHQQSHQQSQQSQSFPVLRGVTPVTTNRRSVSPYNNNHADGYWSGLPTFAQLAPDNVAAAAAARQGPTQLLHQGVAIRPTNLGFSHVVLSEFIGP
jgi:hypothetical protein